MRNFIFFTDVHLRLSSPKRRTDDIFEAQLKKLEWIGQKAKEMKSDFVVCGGDLGDIWDWKISMVNRVSEVLKSFPCQVLTIIGNHDVPGRNLTKYKDTGLGLLNQMGALKIMVPPDKKFFYEHPEAIDSPFYIFPFHSDAPETDKLIAGKTTLDEKLYPLPNKSYVKVAVVHAPIGAETTPFCKGHKELFIDDFDIALFGDIHDGWPIYDSLTGCKICNPGSVTRLTKKDMKRKPQIAIVYEDKAVEYVEVPHTPMEDCFDTSGIDAEKQELGKGFLAAIAARKVVGDIDPKEYIERIGKGAGYSKEVIELLKSEVI